MRKTIWPKLLLALVLLPILIFLGFKGESLFWKNTILLNGRIYTGDTENPWIEAVEVRDGRIHQAGKNAVIETAAGWRSKVIDLQGKTVMPGLHDAHTHLTLGAVNKNIHCPLEEGSDLDSIIAQLQACKTKGRMTNGWLIGGTYDPRIFPQEKPTNTALNQAFPDTPIYLNDFSLHNALVNQAAFDRLGIGPGHQDPVGGAYERDPENDSFTGVLVENASKEVMKQLPLPSPLAMAKAVLLSMEEMNSYGITSIQEAAGIGPAVQLFQLMDMVGMLSLDVSMHWVQGLKDLPMGDPALQQEWLETREDYASDNLHINSVKLLLDGVPLPPTPTDARIDKATGKVDPRNLLHDEAELYAMIDSYDRQGLKVKTHAVGDGAARVLVTALEKVRAKNGPPTARHEIAHAQGIAAEDLPRFVKAGTVLEYSPTFWAMPGKLDEVKFPFNTAVKAGALVTAGSDWPVVPDSNLFPAIAAMTDYGAESVDLETAIRIFTLNGAASLDRDADYGSIAPGKWANLIVLDRNIFDLPPADIAETRVLQTMVKGKTVYQTQ